jgi:hypothetical protein
MAPGDKNIMRSNLGMYRIQLSGNQYELFKDSSSENLILSERQDCSNLKLSDNFFSDWMCISEKILQSSKSTASS